MDTQNLTSYRKRNGKQVSFEFKIFVISQINNGQIFSHFTAKNTILREVISVIDAKQLSYFNQFQTINYKNSQHLLIRDTTYCTKKYDTLRIDKYRKQP